MALITIRRVYKTGTNSPSSQNNRANSRFTNLFATIILIFSITVIGILIWVAYTTIHAIKEDSSFNHAKELFNILLPVIGTWMGTLLAFYFSKDNFAAASQQANDWADRISGSGANLQQLAIKDVMIRTENARPLLFDNLEKFKEDKLVHLLGIMENSQAERLLILEKGTMKFIFMLYRTTIERFFIGWESGEITIPDTPYAPEKKKELTMADMYKSDYKTFEAILNIEAVFISIGATLDKAKEAMQNNSTCQDVYVTKNGSRDEEVLGWITNKLIIEKAGIFRKSGEKG